MDKTNHVLHQDRSKNINLRSFRCLLRTTEEGKLTKWLTLLLIFVYVEPDSIKIIKSISLLSFIQRVNLVLYNSDCSVDTFLLSSLVSLYAPIWFILLLQTILLSKFWMLKTIRIISWLVTLEIVTSYHIRLHLESLHLCIWHHQLYLCRDTSKDVNHLLWLFPFTPNVWC